MPDPIVTIEAYITELGNNFAIDVASIVNFVNVVNFVNDNKYFDNLHIAGQLLFMNTFLENLPQAIIDFKTSIGDIKPDELTGFDINKLLCALDYAINKFPTEFDATYYNELSSPTIGTKFPVNIITDPKTQVEWITLVNTNTSDGTVEKITGGTGWNAKANFKIPTNKQFKIEFKLAGVYSDSFGGVTYADINSHYTDIQYAISVSGTSYYLYSNGTNLTSFGGYVAGDVQRIDRLNNEIKYYVNDVLKYTLPTSGDGPNSNGYMLFDCSIYQEGGRIENILLTYL